MRILSLFCFLALPAFSADPVTAPTPESPWATNAEASLLLTSGNTQVTTLGAGVDTAYQANPWGAKGKFGYLRNILAGSTKAELFTVDGRVDHTVSGQLSAYGQTGFLRNTFAGFNSRLSLDLGVNYSFIKNDFHDLSTEVGFGGLTEDRTDVGSNSFVFVKAGFQYKWKFSPTADLATGLSAMENLKTTGDLRLSSVTSVSVAMTTLLSMKFSFRLDFLNSPVAGKVNTDTATTVALVAKF